MVVTHGRTGKPFATKYAHSLFGQERETVDEAFPGDVVGLVNATEVRVGDALYDGEPVEFPAIPAFAPEHFVIVRVRDTGRFKQFRRASPSSTRRASSRCCATPTSATRRPVLAAVGRLQFEVAATASSTSSARRSS